MRSSWRWPSPGADPGPSGAAADLTYRVSVVGSRSSLLVTVTGIDRPGVAAALFADLAALGVSVLDVEQVQVHGRLLLCVEITEPAGGEAVVRDALARRAADPDLEVSVSVLVPGTRPSIRRTGRQLVTVLGASLGPETLGPLFAEIAASGGNVDRIVRLSSYPVLCYELVVSGGVPDELRRRTAVAAARLQVDVAVQREGLHRRAKHLIVLDVDSTLLQGEVIDLLAARAGRASEVAGVTRAAMAGELDFGQALEKRLALLAGLEADQLEAVAGELQPTPGARTLVRTLKGLGYETAAVSGGFVQVIEEVVHELGIDHLAANVLEIVDGRLTGRLVGPVVDRAGKARELRRFAALAGVPLAQTIAVGDGANDLDMLEAAGLGIAFNAKPIVRDAADTSLSVPYLDAILFLLGISREEIEVADETRGDVLA